MEEDEEGHDHPGPAHGAGCVVGGQVVAGRVAAAPSCHVHPGQRVRRMDVEQGCSQQPDAEHPQEMGTGHEVTAQVAQRLPVFVDLRRADVHLEVAQHVHQHVAEEHHPGDRHHPLLADGGPVELHRPGTSTRAPPGSRASRCHRCSSDRIVAGILAHEIGSHEPRRPGRVAKPHTQRRSRAYSAAPDTRGPQMRPLPRYLPAVISPFDTIDKNLNVDAVAMHSLAQRRRFNLDVVVNHTQHFLKPFGR